MAGVYQRRWSTQVEAPCFNAPQLCGRQVLLQEPWGLVALEADSGRKRWALPGGPRPRRIAWALLQPEGTIFCAGKEKLWRITALDPAGEKRWTALIEADHTEGLLLDRKLWLLASGDSPCLRLFSEKGEMEGLWELPPGCKGLVPEPGALLFIVQSRQEDALYRFTLENHQIDRTYLGELDSVQVHGDRRLLRGKGQDIQITDLSGRLLWRRAGGVGMPRLHDQLSCCVEAAEGWRPSCLDRNNGTLRWELRREETGPWSRLLPLGRHLALVDNSDVELLDPATGATVQILSCDSHNYTGVGPEGYAEGLVVLAEQRWIHAFEWQPGATT